MALWGYLQSASVDGAADTTGTLAFTSNVVSGNLLVVAARINGIGQTLGCSDTRSTVYTEVKKYEGTSTTHAVFTGIAPSSGANTVTFTNTVSGARRWMIHEYDATGLTVVVDQNTHATGTGTAVNSGNVTTTVASELIFGTAITGTGSTYTAGTSFTERQEVALAISSEDRIVTTSGAYAATYTLGTSSSWGCIIVTFKVGGSLLLPRQSRAMRHMLVR